MKTSLHNTPSAPDQSETEGDLDNEPTQNEPEQPDEEKIDHALEETFPASDPISP
ncbi:hypothetical protein [Pseudomonas lijiangensis]|uniref:Uncharacterized protein n=1 Tax=Pseudomonas lijiangensis TaxID=2995658 RepID=A0ABX8I1H8_9PSED|nr:MULTISPECIES: hypothetical protein [Pseudomonas syringae group]MBX8500446.1 hypothetical protein [Pseudomonas lijiangensis]MBX8505095.1 hypothetical protein [Pseudomonas lijiangensis]MBX8521018.1 hypothetical protein [Pseudomonas cichorii]MBX8541894.1 hypothetical protein [Pseudomonas cichorii]MBX8545141.1 hypothetical protein [Pseudomonas cichorii]